MLVGIDGVGIVKSVRILWILHELGGVLSMVGLIEFRGEEMRESALDLFRGEFVAARFDHSGRVPGREGEGTRAEVEINGVGAPAAEDLGNIFADPRAEEGGGPARA